VVALDRDEVGRLYLCDRRNGCVLVLSPALELLEVFGQGHLTDPSGIRVASDGERCHVVDTQRGLVRFEGNSRTPELLAGVGKSGPLRAPHDLALGPDGTMLVTDSALHRVFVFDADGRLVSSWGGRGLGRGELYKPRGIARDGRGRVTVIDHGNHRLQTFTPEGEYVGVFGPRLYTHAARYPEFANPGSDQREEGE
jgi:tripartite motif-containing protein 71